MGILIPNSGTYSLDLAFAAWRSPNGLGQMDTGLVALLPRVLPRAIEWAEGRSRDILDAGMPLPEAGMVLARAVGVVHPERIRISVVTALPLPEDHELRAVALDAGLLGPGMVGVTLGYGIYLCDGHFSNRLISHECRHVQQYEAAGSISDFLPLYLRQIAEFGYANAPYEVDARNHEIDIVPKRDPR